MRRMWALGIFGATVLDPCRDRDVRGNIEAIEAGTWFPGVHDPQAEHVRVCLRLGVSMSLIVRLFETMRDGATTINLVEQGHASHQVLLRQHEQMEERLLRARSTIHQS